MPCRTLAGTRDWTTGHPYGWGTRVRWGRRVAALRRSHTQPGGTGTCGSASSWCLTLRSPCLLLRWLTCSPSASGLRRAYAVAQPPHRTADRSTPHESQGLESLRCPSQPQQFGMGQIPAVTCLRFRQVLITVDLKSDVPRDLAGMRAYNTTTRCRVGGEPFVCQRDRARKWGRTLNARCAPSSRIAQPDTVRRAQPNRLPATAFYSTVRHRP